MAHESCPRPLGDHVQMSKRRRSFATAALRERFAAGGCFRNCLQAIPGSTIDMQMPPALSGAVCALGVAD